MAWVLLGTAEIAALLGVSRQRADQLTKEDPAFPRPAAELVNGRVWDREAVVVWAVLRGRVPDRGVLDIRAIKGEDPARGVIDAARELARDPDRPRAMSALRGALDAYDAAVIRR